MNCLSKFFFYNLLGCPDFVFDFLSLQGGQAWVRGGMGTEIDSPAAQPGDLVPGEVLSPREAFLVVSDKRGRKKNGGGEMMLLQNGEGIGVKVVIAVVKRDCDEFLYCRACREAMSEVRKVDDRVTILFEKSHVLGENGRCGIDPVVWVQVMFLIV